MGQSLVTPWQVRAANDEKLRGGGVLDLSVTSTKINLSSVRCHEDDRIQSQLASLLAKVHRRTEVRTALSPFFLGLPENPGHLYYVPNRSYRVPVFFSESRVAEHQKIGGLQNVKLFSVKSVDRVKYYCGVPKWYMQYELPTLLFVS